MVKALDEIGASNNSRNEWIDALLEIWDQNTIERDRLNFSVKK